MQGVRQILRQLDADAQSEREALLAATRREAVLVVERFQTQAEQERNAQTLQNGRKAARREALLMSAARQTARNTVLATRQAVLTQAYARALERLAHLPEQERQALLTALLRQLPLQGEVLFAPRDREGAGRRAVNAVNWMRGGNLSVSKETLEIPGGFLFRAGSMEINCALDVLLCRQRPETVPAVARCLFAEENA